MEWLTSFSRALCPVVANAISGIEAMRRKITAIEICSSDATLPVTIALLQVWLQTTFDLLACIQDGHSVKVRRCRGCRRRGIGHSVCGGLPDVYVLVRDAKSSGSDLHHLCVQTLTHLRATVRDQDCAVRVDVDESPSLVHELGGEADAEFGGHLCYATLPPFVGLVELPNLLRAPRQLGALCQLPPHPLQRAALHELDEMGLIPFEGIEVAGPELISA
mmetsp:Transcript_96842/g.174938  ORF Transcript_96842/g.174938 Transcript_96842/m.174938 type:complete len:219 (-) Transcript_96842:1484-2140(-)